METFDVSVDGHLRADRYEIAHCGCCEVSETAEGRLFPFFVVDWFEFIVFKPFRSKSHNECSRGMGRFLQEWYVNLP